MSSTAEARFSDTSSSKNLDSASRFDLFPEVLKVQREPNVRLSHLEAVILGPAEQDLGELGGSCGDVFVEDQHV